MNQSYGYTYFGLPEVEQPIIKCYSYTYYDI